MEGLCAKLARYEAGWWKAHHRKDKDARAAECVKFRTEAGKEHDIAKHFEILITVKKKAVL